MRANTWLWIVQGVLAALFLFTGVMKLVLPAQALQGPIPLSPGFLKFIGVCEVLGAIGLVVPWLTRIQPVLTPIAASGLVVIMIGATVLTAMSMSVVTALGPLVLGVLAAIVARNRGRQLANRSPMLRPAR